MAHPRSIFRRSFGVFAVAGLVPIAAMAVQGYHCARRAIVDNRLHLLRQLSVARHEEIEAGVHARARAVGILAEIPELREAMTVATGPSPGREMARETLTALLAGPGRKWVGFESAGLFDLSGNALVIDGAEGPEALWDDEVASHVRASARTGGPPGSSMPVLGPLRASAPGRPFIRVTSAVLRKSGEPAGALVALIDLHDTVASILGEGEIRSYLLAIDGTPLSAIPGGEPAIRAALLAPPTRLKHDACERCLDGSCHSGQYRAPDGTEVIGACAPSQDRKWMVVTESRLDDALSSLRSFVIISGTTSGLSLAAMLIAAALLGRRISRPLQGVAETARRIAGGDLSSRARYDKPDEVGALVTAFNSLVDGLLSSRGELAGRNRELETALAQLSAVRDRLVQTEAISAVGRVAASVVHEIRNPLSSVKMNLQILARPLSGDARYSEHARIALDQVERLETMLSDLLDFGRPLELRPERVKAGACVRRAIADVRARAAARGVEVYSSGGDGIELNADPARVAQALLNLLANAVDASPPGGRVEVQAGEEVRDGTRWARIDVSDAGHGIRAEHLQAIFDPFFTTKEGGTGLGLSMVKKIAALHGGRVEVESEEGRGTRMRLLLPAEAGG